MSLGSVAKRVSVGKAVWWAQGRQVVGAREADGGRREGGLGSKRHSFFGPGLDTTIDQRKEKIIREKEKKK